MEGVGMAVALVASARSSAKPNGWRPPQPTSRRPSSQAGAPLLAVAPELATAARATAIPRTRSAFAAFATSVVVAAARGGRAPRARRRAEAERPKATGTGTGEFEADLGPQRPAPGTNVEDPSLPRVTPAESRAELQKLAGEGGYEALSQDQRTTVSNFFFPDTEQLDMDKSMPLEDHIREFREGLFRAAIALVVCVGICLTYYKELTAALEGPAQWGGVVVKFVQLGPGEFFFVSLKAAIACGFLLAFPYVLFEAALYFTPALTRDERNAIGPTVLSSAILFYAGVAFAFYALSPAALNFFIGYSQDVIESQFSIDQYFDFILTMGFATGLAFQVPVLQVALGILNIVNSEQLFSVWRYVVVGSAVVGAVLTPSTDPVTQLLLSGALCLLYFTGAGTLSVMGR